MGFARKVKKNQKKTEVITMPHNEWAGLHYAYEKHFKSGWNRTGEEELYYTFFADMAVNCNFYTGEKLLKEVKSYEKRMLDMYCKKSAEAYEIMIDSINFLAWYCNRLGNAYSDVMEWAFNEYRRLFYTDWKQYVSEEEMNKIWINLD